MDPHELSSRRVLPVCGRHGVGVARARQAPVSPLDLLTRGAHVDAEDLVKRRARGDGGHVVRVVRRKIRRRRVVIGRSGGEGLRWCEFDAWGGVSGRPGRESWSGENWRGKYREHGMYVEVWLGCGDDGGRKVALGFLNMGNAWWRTKHPSLNIVGEKWDGPGL